MRMTPLLIMLAVAACRANAADPEPAEWWSVDKGVVQELFDRDAGQWARELQGLPMPTAAGELMRRYSVANRAGHLRQAREVIDALSDAKIQKHDLNQMADFLIGRRDWATAGHFLERLPQAEPGWGYVLIKEWSSTGDAKEIDAWLAERMKANPRYWLRERLRFRGDQGTAAELVEEFASQVRKQPENAEVALQFLEATSVVRQSAMDIAWLGEVCRPRSAYPSFRLGQALRGAPRAAIALLEHSLEMPFTKEDAAAMEVGAARAVVARGTEPPWEKQLRYATKQELLSALQRAGESARAQKLLEELADLQKDGLPPAGLDGLAGQIQAVSGARVVQQRFRQAEAEPENKDSAEYWRRRAAYFAGRKERAETIAAYEKAMQLSPLAPKENAAHAHSVQLRYWVLSDFVGYLQSADPKSATLLLERELRQAPLDEIYAQRVVSIIAGPNSPQRLSVDRELLWAYLAAQPKWEHGEERLLWRLVEQPEQREEKWQRAEKLAGDQHPSRSQVLGWVMTRSHASARAIPWLKAASQRLEKPNERGQAAFTLFGAYLDVQDWQAAETIWPIARQRLTPKELPDWLGRIAVAAARKGDQDQSLRIWKQRTNLDRADTTHLDDMLQAGLREPLIEFYRSLAAQDPQCQSIEPVLAAIQTGPTK